MSSLNIGRTRKLLQQFDFENLFIEELGWNRYSEQLFISVGEDAFPLDAVAEKRGLVIFLYKTLPGTDFPPYALRRKIERQTAKTRHEHLIIYVDLEQTTQVWQWVKRETGRPDACREHTYHRGQPGDALIQKLDKLVVTLDEEESISLVEVTGRTRAAFNVEKITKKFYERFKKEHAAFLKFVEGITDLGDRQWYASLMLNRLMFIYFIQKKGFLDDDPDYLRNRLCMMQEKQGKGRFHSFYRHFLLRLFHEGLGKKVDKRVPELDNLLGKVPYLNGGLFDIHELENEYSDIQISDDAFERLFDFFEQYHWHLDERPLRQDNEINPDVLGYIFEKYINQKQMGAYYTKEDITEYISKNTITPYLFDAARKKCKIAFEGEQSVWQHLSRDPDRYIYEAVKKGCEFELPDEVARGLDDISERTEWNKPASEAYALPTEIWREVVARRKRYDEVKAKLAAGEVQAINDCITYNLNIRQFAQDVIENCEGPMLLRAFWHAIVGRIPRKSNEKPENGITILDPTCGSGAFLFAALNILAPLYEACLDRMQAFVAELDQPGVKHHPEKFNDFKAELARVAEHPNQSYFIMKSIILNNLYGVDIMAEAVEICKLRLFLKMVAQVENADQIEPLPDIDFNIRCGNTLVGFATYDEVKEAIKSKGGAAMLPMMYEDRMAKIEQKAQDLQQAFDIFRRRQVEGDGSVPQTDKARVRDRLTVLEDELNRALAGKYGINAEKAGKAYQQWLANHQPFHWFIEYYGIITSDGFDAIIGNPPYVELSKIRSVYGIIGFIAETSGNLYALCLERSMNLLGRTGWMGMVVQQPIVSTNRMNVIRNILLQNSTIVLSSTYDDRPSKLFDGIQHARIAIVINQKADISSQAELYVTPYFKWYKEERSALFEKLFYVNSPFHLDLDVFPKIGSETEVNITNQLIAINQKIRNWMTSRQCKYAIYYKITGVGHWFTVTNRPPKFFRDGLESSSTRENTLLFPKKSTRDCIFTILNSSLFYWFYQVRTNCRDFNPSDYKTFPLPLSLNPDIFSSLADNLQDLLDSSSSLINVRHKNAGNIQIERFRPREAKPIIDEIDRVLAKHYGFTDEELDFIINYDIKYRMGIK